jgi:hypothetical protein
MSRLQVELGEKQSTTVDWVLSERRKSAKSGHSQTKWQQAGLDPKHAFKIGPMNGREAARKRPQAGGDAPRPVAPEPPNSS